MKKSLMTLALLTYAFAGIRAASDADTQTALRNIDRAMAIADATWEKTMRGTDDNLYMVDVYNTQTGEVSGPSDVWPYTAAIEAHCSILEALALVKDVDAALYNEKSAVYKHRLNLLIDNLEYYRGTYRLSSYATSNKECSPYAVPRASRKGGADVRGILNVYDDQMWLSRELIRAYRLTDNKAYLDLATYLTDYVLEGWDCWRDADGKEYGGITWGPGYNSKHACSNAPIIQPLVWLHDIYKDSGAECEYYYRDQENNVKRETRLRSDLYLEFARKVYDWQKEKLQHESGVFWDMMGADNAIKVSRGYRQHVDTGGPVGALISYNTGTMISGASELYRVTGDASLRDDIDEMGRASLSKFSRYVRAHNAYLFNTDETAENGFNSWFNDVLMRSYIDACPYASVNSPAVALNSFQVFLDYAYENHNRDNLLPIHLLDGWGAEVKTKGFHQFAFVSEYAMLAVYLLTKDKTPDGIARIPSGTSSGRSAGVYTLSGVRVGSTVDIPVGLRRGIYIVGDRKRVMGD